MSSSIVIYLANLRQIVQFTINPLWPVFSTVMGGGDGANVEIGKCENVEMSGTPEMEALKLGNGKKISFFNLCNPW